MSKAATGKVGSLWEVSASEPVDIVRPDGSSVRVAPRDGTASHVLDVPGVYHCGDQQITAK